MLGMTLDEYITQTGETALDFAELAGVNPSTISRLRRGICLPDWPTLAKIDIATGGKVKPNDFLVEWLESADAE